jgi:hypothetical protein
MIGNSMTTQPPIHSLLSANLEAIITPENVRLGHTWLKRKLREAIAAMGEAPMIAATASPALDLVDKFAEASRQPVRDERFVDHLPREIPLIDLVKALPVLKAPLLGSNFTDCVERYPLLDLLESMQIAPKPVLSKLATLQHEYDSTRGLWCIDRNPSEVDHEWIKKNAFQLK